MGLSPSSRLWRTWRTRPWSFHGVPTAPRPHCGCFVHESLREKISLLARRMPWWGTGHHFSCKKIPTLCFQLTYIESISHLPDVKQCKNTWNHVVKNHSQNQESLQTLQKRFKIKQIYQKPHQDIKHHVNLVNHFHILSWHHGVACPPPAVPGVRAQRGAARRDALGLGKSHAGSRPCLTGTMGKKVGKTMGKWWWLMVHNHWLILVGGLVYHQLDKMMGTSPR